MPIDQRSLKSTYISTFKLKFYISLLGTITLRLRPTKNLWIHYWVKRSMSVSSWGHACKNSWTGRERKVRRRQGNKVNDDITNEIHTLKRFRINYERIYLLIFHHKLPGHPQPWLASVLSQQHQIPPQKHTKIQNKPNPHQIFPYKR